MGKAKELFKPGDIVPKSGVYRVVHDKNHTEPHQVTCIKGKPFPPCNHCGEHPRFELQAAAHHVTVHAFFKPRPETPPKKK